MRSGSMTRRRMLMTSAAAGVGSFLPWEEFFAAGADAGGFRLGACDWSIRSAGRLAAFDTAAAIGLDGVQFSFGLPGQYEVDLRTAEAREACARRVKETGVRVASLALGVLNKEPLATSDRAEACVADCIEALTHMPERNVLLAFFGKGSLLDKPEARAAVIERLKRLARKAEQAGVTLSLETQLDADGHLEIIEGVGSPAVKVYYDVANMTYQGYDVPGEIRRLGGRGLISEIHMKERGCLLGHGEVDFRAVRAAMEDAGYRGWLILEGALPKGAPVAGAYAENARFLRRLFPVVTPAAGLTATPPFHLSLSERSLQRSIVEGELKHEDVPAFVKEEFGVEILDFAGRFFDEKGRSGPALADLKRRCIDHGVAPGVFLSDVPGLLGDPDPAVRKAVVDAHGPWLDAARALGCESYRVHPRSRGDWYEQVANTADGVRRLCEGARARGLTVLLENEGGQAANWAWLLAVVERVDMDNCRVMADFGGFDGYDALKGVRALMPHAAAISARSRSFTDNGLERTVDFHALMRAVLASGFAGVVSIEYLGAALSETQGIRATQRLLERIRAHPEENVSGTGKPAARPALRKVDFGARRGWSIERVDSQEEKREKAVGSRVLDGDARTFWHTDWSDKNPAPPHEIVVDMGDERLVKGIRYLPRQDMNNGRIATYEVYVTNDPETPGNPVAAGKFPDSPEEQQVRFDGVKGRYFVLRALAEVRGRNWTTVAELGAFTD